MSDNLQKHPIHLGLGATAIVQPEMSGGLEWYEAYGQRHGDDGREGRLVAMHSFSGNWDMWEMHPNGAEAVICTAGAVTIIQEFPDGSRKSIHLVVGDYAINPPGIWHTADVTDNATAIFITAGEGTQHRKR